MGSQVERFIDLEEDERDKLGDLLESKAIDLGMDKWAAGRGGRGQETLKSEVGICYNCQNMQYCKTEFGSIHAFCYTFKIRLDNKDRMVDCNNHSERGRMTLRDMEMIATIIDIDDEKIHGFISNDPKLRSKK